MKKLLVLFIFLPFLLCAQSPRYMLPKSADDSGFIPKTIMVDGEERPNTCQLTIRQIFRGKTCLADDYLNVKHTGDLKPVLDAKAARYRDLLVQYQNMAATNKKQVLVFVNGQPTRRDLTKINPYLVNYIKEKEGSMLCPDCNSDKVPKKLILISLNE